MVTVNRSRNRGFTLIEIVLVLAIGGVLLVGAASLVFGLFQLRIAAEQAPQYDEHVSNVRRFLEFAFAEAEPIQNLGEEGGQPPETAVAWRNLPGTSDLNEEVLAFRLPGEIPIFMDDEIYLPSADCYLRFVEGEGLSLYWQTDVMAAEDADDLRRTLLSPAVEKLEYLWYDAEDEKWEVSEEAEERDNGEMTPPDFIRLTFAGDPDTPPTALLLLPPSDPEVLRL